MKQKQKRSSDSLNITTVAQSHPRFLKPRQVQIRMASTTKQLLTMSELFVQTFNELCFFCYRTSTNIFQAVFIEFFKGQM